MENLQAYINIESTASAGTALLFEAGPGNGWIVKPWARAAPHPRGVSFATEIYKRLPNDTDFSILKRYGIPGLNFALIRDSYPYHTARDTAERVPDASLRTTGENAVAVALALDALDLGAHVSDTHAANETFFDIGRTVAVAWGPVVAWLIAAGALTTGLLAWFKVIGASIRLVGLGRWIFEVIWSLLGAAGVAVAMVGGTWALRATRAVYHPWYAVLGAGRRRARRVCTDCGIHRDGSVAGCRSPAAGRSCGILGRRTYRVRRRARRRRDRPAA